MAAVSITHFKYYFINFSVFSRQRGNLRHRIRLSPGNLRASSQICPQGGTGSLAGQNILIAAMTRMIAYLRRSLTKEAPVITVRSLRGYRKIGCLPGYAMTSTASCNASYDHPPVLSATRFAEDLSEDFPAVRRSNGSTRKPSIAVFHTNSTFFPSINGMG